MPLANRFWLFLYSTPNIVGCVLGLVGLLLFFSGLIRSYWPFIVAGLYLAGFIGCPRDEHVSLRISKELESEQIIDELRQLIARVGKRVGQEIAVQVDRIAGHIIEMLPRLDNAPNPRHILVQTATDYLPTMLEHYLNLPPTYAKMHTLKGGKTAYRLLLEQLEILEQQMQAIAHDLHAGNIDALQVYATFLAEKFGTDSQWTIKKGEEKAIK